MSTRKTVDRVVIALLICIMIATTVYFAVFAITAALAKSDGSSSSDTSEEHAPISPEYEADGDHPLVEYAIKCDRDYNAFIEMLRSDARYSNPVSSSHAFSYMYNPEHKMLIGSLEFIPVAPFMGSDYYGSIIESEEFKAAFPARTHSFMFEDRTYCVYYAGCEDSHIKEFLSKYSLEQDAQELGKIFRIEEISLDGEAYTHTLSTGLKITMIKPLSVIFEMKDYTFEYSYSKK